MVGSTFLFTISDVKVTQTAWHQEQVAQHRTPPGVVFFGKYCNAGVYNVIHKYEFFICLNRQKKLNHIFRNDVYVIQMH
jgi:hypothetical protein